MRFSKGGIFTSVLSKSRPIAAALAVILLAAGCSKADEPAPAPEPTVEDVADGPGFHLQDMWMLFDITGMDETGKSESILSALLDEVSSQAGEPVSLTDFLEFSPLPEFEAAMVSPDGEILDEVEITFGLFGMPDGFSDPAAGEQTLGFITSVPTTVRNVMGGDELVLNLNQFESTKNYETVLLDFAMGQARPVPNEAGLDAMETLQARFAGGSVTWVGSGAEGNLEPAMWRGVPGSKVSPAAMAFSEDADLASTAGSAGLQTTTAPASTMGAASMAPTVLPAPVPARGPGSSSFGVKPAFTGKGGLALTVFCFAGTLIVTGGAGVLFGSVFCTLIGGMGALNDALNAIDDNNGGGNRHPGPGGGFWGDPHITTFDGANQPLMLVGEFDAAISDAMRLQLRTAPTSPNSTVTYNIAAAVEVGADILIADTTRAAAEQMRVNGEPLALESSEQHELENGTTITKFGNTYDITAPNGHAVVIAMHGNSLDAHYYLPPDHTPDTAAMTGLLGDADGDPGNDFFTRDGSIISDFTREQFYEEIAQSWRVSEADNLFDTPLTHDHSFPKAKAQPSDQGVAWATQLCTGMGLSGYYLEACITDVAATMDAAYVMRAMAGQSIHSPETFALEGPSTAAGNAAIQLKGMRAGLHQPARDDAGHVLVSAARVEDDSGVLIALNDDGSTAWQAPMEHTGCGFAVIGNRAVVPAYDKVGDDEIFIMRLINTEDGSEIDTFSAEHLSPRSCTALTTVGDLVVASSTGDAGHLLGINTRTAEPVFDTELAHISTRAIASGDGKLWAITSESGQVFANQLDPKSGSVTSKTKLPATAVASAEAGVAATSDGFIARLADGESELLLRFAGTKVAWATPFPLDIGDKTYQAPSRISADSQTVAGYATASVVIVLDVETGQPVGSVSPSSFNNNGSQIAHHGGNVVVGPFGGKAWVEVYDVRSGEQMWSTDAPAAIPTNDAKAMHSLGDDRIVIQSGKDSNALIAIYAVP